MTPRLTAVVGSLLLLAPPQVAPQVVAAAAPQTSPSQDDAEQLKIGIAQTQEGDFAAAITTLDPVARRLAKDPARAQDAARAYVYIAMAYMGLSQEQMARAKFLEAWRADRTMELSSNEFPPPVLRAFEEVAKEAEGSPGTAAAAAAPSSAPPVPPPAAKKKSKTVPILLGLGAAAGVGVAVAAGGGGGDGGSGGPSSTPTPAPSPSAAAISAVSGQAINCKVVVPITITVTNPGTTSLAVTAVRRVTTVPAGNCLAASQATYVPDVASVGPGQTVTVLQRPSLYSRGAGCCSAGVACDGSCTVQHVFTVESGAGPLSTAPMSYVLQFVACDPCPTFGAAEGLACPRPN
jgi:hypothetical protein